MKQPMTVNLLNMLKNLLGMYEYENIEVLVLEAVANGMDAGADTININLERDSNGCYVTFHNNGVPMNETDFVNYHTVAVSTKEKGKGIGFAGVGAKIFMAAWQDAEITTITGKGGNVFVSRMWREKLGNGKDEVMLETNTDGTRTKAIIGHSVSDHEYGTTYTVRVPEDGYAWLRKNLQESLRFWFNAALISKQLSLAIGDIQVLPWKPKGKSFQKTSKHNDYRMPCRIWVTNDEIKPDLRHVTYYVYGKRIKNEQVDWIAQVKPRYEKRIFCMADVTVLADHLTSNKESFERNYHTNKILARVKKDFYEILKANGYLRDASKEISDTQVVVNELTERLNKALRMPELKQFNPFAKIVRQDLPVQSDDGSIMVGEMEGSQASMDSKNGSSSHQENAPGDNQDGTSHFEDEKSKQPGETKPRKSRGIGIIPLDAPQDEREGWLDPSTGAVVYNIGHSFHKRVENNPSLHDYNLTRVVISSLIKAKNEELEMDAITTFTHFEDILHRVWL